ncbi:uncharacterized coiled-coil DUF342 family protein [Neorhizobium galegae]|uniref:chemotaxis protein n=1 Tax=Neorhizobium galegae TaxID=399 RepID=UPI001AE54EA8|nr:chemotaxis protein [Neorhizobium galegae]MBP2548524.1 uncharacterized coiled-coil DUF342 family protein [Neorhizobium galegae]
MALSAAAKQLSILGGNSVRHTVDRMEDARSRIEQRFLDGGGVLLSVLDILNKMIASLDNLTGSLDEGTAKATMGELNTTVAALSQLTAAEGERQVRFREISSTERVLRPHVSSMQETLRYLRTFAVTAKITGAGIDDFAGFAEEILQRIQEGAQQVNNFSDKLRDLGEGLAPVIVKGDAILLRYGQTVPKIVASLSTGVDQIRDQRRHLAERADKVRIIARGIQNKLASTLSAMQIGDITRQRVEHCQTSFEILEDYLATPQAASLTGEDRERLSAIIRQLVSLQLDQTRGDFDRDTRKIVETIESFREDLLEITQIQQSMMGEGDGQSTHALRELEQGVSEAREAVAEIDLVAQAASNLSRTTVGTVRDLLDGISLVQVVRGDIHYMALNTNLRCGKIGEAGKAINVVTAELRVFAGHLDEAAEKILAELHVLENAAQQLLNDPQALSDEENLDVRLERALARIRAVGDSMDADLKVMAEEGRAGVNAMNASLKRLDFHAELGAILSACADDIAVDPRQDLSAAGLDAALAAIGPQIAQIYTMASERELHAHVLGTELAPEEPVTPLSDDDLEDALF